LKEEKAKNEKSEARTEKRSQSIPEKGKSRGGDFENLRGDSGPRSETVPPLGSEKPKSHKIIDREKAARTAW